MQDGSHEAGGGGSGLIGSGVHGGGGGLLGRAEPGVQESRLLEAVGREDGRGLVLEGDGTVKEEFTDESFSLISRINISMTLSFFLLLIIFVLQTTEFRQLIIF